MNIFNIKLNFFETKMDKFFTHFFKNEDVIFYLKEKNLTPLQIKHHYKPLFTHFNSFFEDPTIKKYFVLKDYCLSVNDYNKTELNIFYFYMLNHGSLFYQYNNLTEVDINYNSKTKHFKPNDTILKSKVNTIIESVVLSHIALDTMSFSMLSYLAKKEDFKEIFSQKNTLSLLLDKMDTCLSEEKKFFYFESFFPLIAPSGIKEEYLNEWESIYSTIQSYKNYLIQEEKKHLEKELVNINPSVNKKRQKI